MAAKQKWIRGDVEVARKLLENGFQSVVNKEAIYLAAVKLERESGENERARKLLAAARIGCHNSEKVMVLMITKLVMMFFGSDMDAICAIGAHVEGI